MESYKLCLLSFRDSTGLRYQWKHHQGPPQYPGCRRPQLPRLYHPRRCWGQGGMGRHANWLGMG